MLDPGTDQRLLRVRRRFWIEVGAAALSTLLVGVTVVWPDWLEIGFGLDPDGGSGAVEWLIVGVVAVLALGCSVLARSE
jgi:hypothetical protein